MSTIYLGNIAAHEVHHAESAPAGVTDAFGGQDSGLVVRDRADLGETVTVMGPFPADRTPLEALSEVVGAWGYHSTQPPAWVAGDDDALVGLLAAQFGCEVKAHAQAVEQYVSAAGVQSEEK